MFRPPIVRAFSRVSPRPATASSSSRIASRIPRSSSAVLPSVRALRRFQCRSFSKSARTNARESNNYEQFGDGARTSDLLTWKNLIYPITAMVAFYVSNLETVEITGRTRFNCIPAWLVKLVAEDDYHYMLKHLKHELLPDDHPLTLEVREVCERLVAHAPVHDADWKVHIVHDMTQQNAFVLPGGKVFVYSGLFIPLRDADGLAGVLGHEIGHVLAGHDAEQMSRNLFDVAVRFLFIHTIGRFGIYAAEVLRRGIDIDLPNSREKEAEADNIGLMLMAKACYNPLAAVKFWENNHLNDDNIMPQFLSTHPLPFDRMQALSERLYRAEALYEDSGCHIVRGYISGFGDAVDHYAHWDTGKYDS